MIAKVKTVAIALIVAIAAISSAAAAPGKGKGGGGGGGAPAAHGGGGAPAAHIGGGGHPSFGGGHPSFARPAISHPSFGGGGLRHFSAPSRLSGGSARAARIFRGSRGSVAARSFSTRHARGSASAVAAARVRGARSLAASRTGSRLSARDFRSRRAAARSDARAARISARRDAAAAQALRRSAAAAPTTTGSIGRAFAARQSANAGWYGNWRRHHHHLGIGWFGPLFWPYAYDSIFGNVFYPYAYDYDPFWDYGYGDIYTAMFYPYTYEQLVDLPPPLRGRGVRVASRGNPGAATMQRLAPLCGDDSREVAGVPIDQIQTAVEPNDAQRAALDELGNAAIKAAQIVKDACPNDIALTPTGRLAAMRHRIEAMIQAVAAVREPLEKFYNMLSDEQKARFDAIGQNAATASSNPRSLMGKCDVSEVTQWPTAQIERSVRPNESQLASLNALKQAADEAAQGLKNSCPAEMPVTPSARFDAISGRLNAMLDAIKTVSGPLNEFYTSLSDEQKAQFNSIGRSRSSRQG